MDPIRNNELTEKSYKFENLQKIGLMDIREGFEDANLYNFVIEPITNEAGDVIDARFLEADALAAKIIGKPREKLIGRLRSETLGFLNEEQIKLYTDILHSEKTVLLEVYFPNADKWMEVSAYMKSPKKMAVLGYDM